MIPSKTLKYRRFREHPFADNILRDDLLKTADKNRKTKQIDLAIMKTASEKAGSRLDAKDWIIVNYILKGGEGSASDDGPTGTTKKNVLRIPKIKLD